MSTKVVLLINFRFFEKPDFFPDLLEDEDEDEESNSDGDIGDGKSGATSKKVSRQEKTMTTGADERGTAKEAATTGRRLSYWEDKPIARGIIQTLPREVRAVGGEKVRGLEVLRTDRR
jgi:hypothetical protein